MEKNKKEAFVRNHKRKKSKGGLIKRIGNLHYFDDGGTVLGGPTTVGGGQSPNDRNSLLGGINQTLGLNNQFTASGANIQQGTNAAQLNQAYQGAQSGLTQQQVLANQLQAQGAQGMNTQSNLTGQLEGVIAGTGPNAAQTALNQNTAANVANQAALMAGQRGAGANAGLIARQAAMQGANTQQQAVGQAATLQAQQQIAAQQQLQGLAGTQIGQQAGAIQGVNQTQQNEQNILQGANTSANNAAVSMQENINNTNAAIAAANQQGRNQTMNGLLGLGASAVGFSHGGEVPHMAGGGLTVNPVAAAPMGAAPWQMSTPVVAAPISAGDPMSMPGGSSEGLSNASDLGKAIHDKGKKKPDQVGNSPGNDMFSGQSQEISGTSPLVGGGAAGGAFMEAHGGEIHPDQYHDHFHNYFSGGGESGAVPAMVSPGEIYLSPEKVRAVIHEGADPMKIGEKIKGKAKIKNDSLKNDTVPKTLEEGGVVIPRHIATHKMAADKAALFVHRAMAKKKARG